MSAITSTDPHAPRFHASDENDLLDGFQTASALLDQLLSNVPYRKVLVIAFNARPAGFSSTNLDIEQRILSSAEPSPTLPWDDEVFDAVCALDVIHRFAPTTRASFLAECLRVARAGIILGQPGNDPQILQAEQFVQVLYRERFHCAHPAFPADGFDRPGPTEIHALFGDRNLTAADTLNAPLNGWLAARLRADHGLYSSLSHPDLATSSIAYRHFFVASKSGDAARPPFETSVADAGEYGNDSLLPAIGATLGKMLSELDLAKQEQAVQASRHEIQAAAVHRLLSSMNWQRLARSRRFSITLADLVPAPKLVPIADKPNTWRSRDDHPYLEATCPLPAGWIKLQIRVCQLGGQRRERQTAEIYADFGAGFAHAKPLESIYWCDKLDATEVFVHLPRPVIGLRFRPLEGRTVFTVEEFATSCVAPWQALRMAIRRKVMLVRRSRRMGRSLLKALRLLVTGRWLGLWNRLFRSLPDSLQPKSATDVLPEVCASWLKRSPLPEAERSRSVREIEGMTDPPTLAILLQVDSVPDSILRTVLESIRRQTYPHWQLVCHLSPRTPYPHPALEPFTDSDKRFRVVPALAEDDPFANWQDLLDAVETSHVVVANTGYELAETALHRLVKHLQSHRQSDLILNRRGDDSGEIRLFRTSDGGHELNVFRTDDLRQCHCNSDWETPPGIDLARQLMQRGKTASYLAEALTYHCANLAQVPIAGANDDERLIKLDAKPAEPIMITGDIMGISGWDQLVFEIARGLGSIGFDVRLNSESTIATHLLPPYMVPLIRPRTTADRELTICSPFFLSHHKPLPGNAIFTMWEADQFTAEWVAILNRASRIFVPSDWGADCMRTAGVTVPISIVPLGHDPLTYYPDGSFSEICTFGTAAALWGGGIRKNTLRLIELFQRAFPDETDVRLRVKVTSRCELPECGDPRIEILRTYLRPEALADWYRSLTVFVNTSYSEGFGLHLLEAMACGRAIVSTNYSGVTAYFDDEVGYAVDHRLIPIQENPIYRGRWAEPYDRSLIAALRRVYEMPAEARRKGERAAVRARCLTWKETGRRLNKFLCPDY